MTTDDEEHNRWMNLYTIAYLERDPVKLMERIAEAEQAMILRRKNLELRGTTNGAEYRALEYSLKDLHILRQQESQHEG
jgi:hypothetical protein